MKSLSLLVAASLAMSASFAPGQESDPERFQFRAPHVIAYRLTTDPARRVAPGAGTEWLTARIDGNSTNTVELGRRLVLQLDSPTELDRLIRGRPLELARVVRSNLFILQAPDALTAAGEAHRLAARAGVSACAPVLRRRDIQHGPYAPHSNDPFAIPYFISGGGQFIDAEWPIEHLDGNGNRLGLDLGVLSAWPFTAGAGVTVAVADGGVEMTHPELVNRLAGGPHFNFVTMSTNNPGPIGGGQFEPLRSLWTHGTSAAGLIAAERNNTKGMTGVAPLAQVASWLIFTTNGNSVSDEVLMDMYTYASNLVAVQNHSWGAGNGLRQQAGPSLLELVGLEAAVTLGRHGRGTVMIRSAGNDRALAVYANDDGYVNSPDVIPVAAVNKNGRATSYSEPGACVLIAAPGGGGDSPQGLFTLDLVGWERGINAGIFYGGDLADYRWGVQGFIGTSAAAPLISGTAALILSANTNLGYRDVQQILLLSSRHWDTTDPDLVTNGAGLRVSHNVGFGVPNAGQAVWLARQWSNRPPLVSLTLANHQSLAIPDSGLRVEVTGSNIPPALASIAAFPTFAPGSDDPTPFLNLVDAGVATNVPAANLTNQAALMLHDGSSFGAKISNAAQAGAVFAVIYNSTDGGGFDLGLITDTDYSPIPAVFIGNSSGEGLKALFQTNASARARLRLFTADRVFSVNSTLLCEHVGVRVRTDHSLRGDVRITVKSPLGTRSVLQHFNDDITPGPTDWTYWTTHHFLESSAGDWTVSLSDEFGGATGSVLSVSLILRGTQITDTDHDGLDDGWESARLGSLAYGPQDDPDGDGYANAREQVMGTNPSASDLLTTPDLSSWGLFGSQMMRLSWASSAQYDYQILGGSTLTALTVITNLPGSVFESELFVPFSTAQNAFYKIRALQKP